MNTNIEQLDNLSPYLQAKLYGHLADHEKAIMNNCLTTTRNLWGWLVNGEVACIWGLIPPTLMSSQAYLWLYTTELMKDHTFLFIRHSQRAMEKMLDEYPIIVGHCLADNPRAIRWLKWLGATFGDPVGKGLPFTIMRKP